MGNMIAGLDLLRRTASPGGPPPPPAFGLTFPLLTKADGTKMGKSAGGAGWLAPTARAPFKFYQYLLTSVSDDEVVRFLRMLTFLPLTEIDSVEAAMAAGPAGGYAPNTAQRLLAAEVTRFVHGEDGLRQALAATDALRPGADTALDVETLEAAAGDAPTASMPRENVVGAALADVMAAVGLQPSKAAVRRLIKVGLPAGWEGWSGAGRQAVGGRPAVGARLSTASRAHTRHPTPPAPSAGRGCAGEQCQGRRRGGGAGRGRPGGGASGAAGGGQEEQAAAAGGGVRAGVVGGEVAAAAGVCQGQAHIACTVGPPRQPARARCEFPRPHAVSPACRTRRPRLPWPGRRASWASRAEDARPRC